VSVIQNIEKLFAAGGVPKGVGEIGFAALWTVVVSV
jgi:hypothetical protein